MAPVANRRRSLLLGAGQVVRSPGVHYFGEMGGVWAREQAAHGVEQGGNVEGLFEQRIDPEFGGTASLAGSRGDDDDRNERIQFDHDLKRLPAVDVWHIDVEQYQIRRAFEELANGFAPIAGQPHGEVFQPQNFRE